MLHKNLYELVLLINIIQYNYKIKITFSASLYNANTLNFDADFSYKYNAFNSSFKILSYNNPKLH